VPDDNPVACCLTDVELRQREATLLAQFKSALTATEEIADGYAFRIPGENRWLALVADLIIAERECCPFLTFELTAEPRMGALTIRITGPEGTKEFLKSQPVELAGQQSQGEPEDCAGNLGALADSDHARLLYGRRPRRDDLGSRKVS
jgi:hypothetical protein